MFPTDTFQYEILWNRLQEPTYPTQLPQEYLLLLAALDTGWEIKGPVHLLHPGNSTDNLYLFNLHHKRLSHTIQLAIPAGPVIENFLCEERLAVAMNDTICTLLQAGLVC